MEKPRVQPEGGTKWFFWVPKNFQVNETITLQLSKITASKVGDKEQTHTDSDTLLKGLQSYQLTAKTLIMRNP